MRIVIHAPERKLPPRKGFDYDSQRITGVTYEYDASEVPSDPAAREAFIDAHRKKQLAEMDRQEALILGRHETPHVVPAPAPAVVSPVASHGSAQQFADKPSSGVQNPPAPTTQATPPPQPAAPRFLCSGRGHRVPAGISQAEHEYSMKRWGKALCRPCQADQHRR